MRTTGRTDFAGLPARRLILLLSAHDRVRHETLVMQILRQARKHKLAGASVFEASEGFGASGQVHREHLLRGDRPIAIVIIDRPDKIDSFLEKIRPLADGVVATVEEIEIVDL